MAPGRRALWQFGVWAGGLVPRPRRFVYPPRRETEGLSRVVLRPNDAPWLRRSSVGGLLARVPLMGVGDCKLARRTPRPGAEEQPPPRSEARVTERARRVRREVRLRGRCRGTACRARTPKATVSESQPARRTRRSRLRTPAPHELSRLASRHACPARPVSGRRPFSLDPPPRAGYPLGHRSCRRGSLGKVLSCKPLSKLRGKRFAKSAGFSASSAPGTPRA